MALPGAQAATRPGSAAQIGSNGSRQPITPVEAGANACPAAPACSASRWTTVMASSTPEATPTLATALLIRTPRTGTRPVSRSATICTGAPRRVLRVSVAAKASVGRSANSSVTRSGNSLPGRSGGSNAVAAVATPNPGGRVPRASSAAR